MKIFLKLNLDVTTIEIELDVTTIDFLTKEYSYYFRYESYILIISVQLLSYTLGNYNNNNNAFFLCMLQVPSREIDKSESRFWTHWNRETKQVRVGKCLFSTGAETDSLSVPFGSSLCINKVDQIQSVMF